MISTNSIRLNRFLFATICLGFIHEPVAAPVAIPIYAPAEAATSLNGNDWVTPFDPESPGRFQQVFDHSLFAPIEQAGGGFIATISFRVDAWLGHSFDVTLPSFQLNLSTTSRSVDGLSPVFSENVGSDDMMVLSPQSIFLSGAGGNGFTGFHVNFGFLSNPFFYDPANGNLLLDFRIYQGIGEVPHPAGAIILDAFTVVGDSVSSVYAFGPNLPTTGQTSTLGLAAAIRIIPVPEPSTLALLAFGLMCVGGLGWKRIRKG